ncbi:MAG: nucleotidyl transferase AbiEii/AbiGii toxin family protein [Candidatus Hydrogenedens sp.]|nr:nucleotidyl transferase AbiEii/AbiGii toxin family protein [Candidatus Hydrogenedens sp.]
MDTGIHMAFKGGTSLSKVFQAISRFSEDVDITLDFRDLIPNPDIDIFSTHTSKSAKKNFNKKLKAKAKNHILEVLYPALSQSFSEVTNGKGRMEADKDGETLWLHYPVLTQENEGYMGNWILVEFGGRNTIEPNEPHFLTTLISEGLPELQFPEAHVIVLAAERTFWEKATLIHVECNRPQRGNHPNRLSRHFYDLVMLSRCEIGQHALTDRLLLEDVIRHKTLFFNSNYAHYTECLAGNFRLVPQEPFLSHIKQDYATMRSAGMFESEVPNFEDLIEELRAIQLIINE